MVVPPDVKRGAVGAVLEGVRHLINDLLHEGLGSLLHHSPTHETARFPLNGRDDESLVFFSPTKVNNSSNSTCSGDSVGFTGTSGTCLTAALNHANTIACVTPTCLAADRKLLPSNTRLIARCLVSSLAPTGVGVGVVTR